MKTQLVADGIWARLTKEAKKCSTSAFVAVAYFGQGASKLLPLKAGSRLVVDASEKSVKSSQTCPAELLLLTNKGVLVYSVQNLHAKVYVFGKKAFIGSANVSHHSAHDLVEAMALITDKTGANGAKAFVKRLCRNQLTPKQLENLSRLYKPPKGFTQSKRRRKTGSAVPDLPLLSIVNLHDESWSEKLQREHDIGEKKATEYQKHPRSYERDSFRWRGSCKVKRGMKLLLIADGGSNRRLVDPPSNVLHVRKYAHNLGKGAFVYVEYPCRRRRELSAFARSIGRGALRRLKRGGRVNRDFAERVLKAWER